MDLVTNKYGDIIITVTSHDTLKTYEYDPKKSVSIKTSLNLENFHDFKLIHSSKEYHIYANIVARNKCPAIIEGGTSGAAVVIVLNNTHVVLVKDRMKPHWTNPCGTRASATESFEACALREVKEETGIALTSSLIECGAWKSEMRVYDMQFPVQTKLFYTHLYPSPEQIEKLLAYHDEEIEKVLVVPFEEIGKYQISEHHALAMNFVWGKIRGLEYKWSSNIPKYLHELTLY
jgi:8-oxo-dGTP pyrophosphatase MutT (NUDIX family)